MTGKTQNNKRKPGYMQVTRKCNNNCVFCSNPKFDEYHSIDYIEKLLDEYKNNGVTEVYLTGGEPTIHPRILEIISLVKKKDMVARIITNGIKLSDETFFSKLIDSGVDSINISFHTHAEGLSQKMYGNKDVIKKQKKALALNEKINKTLPLYINITINSMNYTHLPEFIEYISKNYKRVNHIIFNFLDPGTPDGINISSAAKNPWIIVKHSDMEPYLKKTLDTLKKNNITFRVERVPLCYLTENEQFSTETRRIVKKEEYNALFLRQKNKSELRRIKGHDGRIKFKSCSICSLNDICAGVQNDYVKLHGSKEFYPIFHNKENIIKKII